MQSALGFVWEQTSRRSEWMAEPEAKGVAAINTTKIMARVLSHRVWADQRRGWRYTNPNLEELGLFSAQYLALDELAEDDAAFQTAPEVLRLASAGTRRSALSELFHTLRRGLAVTTEALDPIKLEELGTAARQSLKEPWSIGQRERQRYASALMIEAPHHSQVGLQNEGLIIRGGSRSSLAKKLNTAQLWGRRLRAKEYEELVTALLKAAESYQIVKQVQTSFDAPGWRLAADAVRFVSGAGRKMVVHPTPISSTSTRRWRTRC